MTGEWRWTPERNLGVWRHGAPWLRPVCAAAPYLAVGLLMMTLHLASGSLTATTGVLFDLPESREAAGETAELTVLVMMVGHDTMAFFDDSRYMLDDAVSMRGFGESLSECLSRSERKTVLLLADRRVSIDRLMKLMDFARSSGAEKVFVAGKRPEGAE